MSEIFIQPQEQVVVIQAAQSVEIIEPDHIEVVGIPTVEIEIRSPGLVGPSGAPGTANVIIHSLIAPSNFSGQRVVVPDSNGHFVYADPFDTTHLNRSYLLTQSAIMTGDTPELLADGEFVEPTWSWATGSPIYLGTTGTLVTTPPDGAAFLVKLGSAITSTKIYYNPSQPIRLI